jgi:hypothetical protein
MKSNYKFLLFLISFALVITSCREDEDILGTPTEVEIDVPRIDVDASVLGLVTNENGNPVINASVIIDDDLISTTDINGVFVTQQMVLNQNGSHIKILKDGYFIGSTFVMPRDGSDVYTEIELIEKNLIESFSSQEGIDIIINDEAAINIPADAIRTEEGTSYSGDVNVYAHWYDPTDPLLNQRMPGDLRGFSSSREFRQLETYGMISIELEDSNGNVLNIKSESTAELSFPVPADILNSAPSSIPLWHFDEISGYWIEDGSATLVDGKYVGEVSHFSTWNCDVPWTSSTVTGRLVNESGEGIVNTQLIFWASSNAGGRIAWSDADGYFQVDLINDFSYTIEVRNGCKDVIYSDPSVGIITTDITLDDIVIPDLLENRIRVIGTLSKCSGEPLDWGYFRVLINNQHSNFRSQPNGSTEINYEIFTCEEVTSVQIQALDKENGLVSELMEFPVGPSNEVLFGNLIACDQANEFIQISLLDEEFLFVNVSVTPWENGLFIRGSHPVATSSDSSFISILLAEVVLDEPIEPASFTAAFSMFDWFTSCEPEECQDMEVVISENGDIGEFVKGSFDVLIDFNDDGIEDECVGEFNIIRRN